MKNYTKNRTNLYLEGYDFDVDVSTGVATSPTEGALS